ncbi:Transcription factor MYB1R1 [Spatholobus suberectus]|nr:Transcription factor MYB1R1 [Spatholobus suberectus]
MEEVKEWLAKTFKGDKKAVLEFEYTPRSVSHLHLVARDFLLKAFEYRSQDSETKEYEDHCAILVELLVWLSATCNSCQRLFTRVATIVIPKTLMPSEHSIILVTLNISQKSPSFAGSESLNFSNFGLFKPESLVDPLVSAVGTPVNLPAPAHMAHGLGALVPGAVVPGAPMNMGPLPYPMPHTSAHR